VAVGAATCARSQVLSAPIDCWVGAAGDASRAGWLGAPAPTLQRVAWIATSDETGAAIDFIAQAGVAVAPRRLGDLVMALGRVSRPGGTPNEPRAFAFSRSTGGCVWSSPVAPGVLGSMSSPTIDSVRGTVIIASGREVTAFAAHSGELVWTATLAREIVNASAIVTDDLPGRDRLFITDYDGAGAEASLYCINVCPFDASQNAFVPGEIVWRVAIGGSSGNTPAYLRRRDGGVGLVYVASVGEFSFNAGKIFAFAANADTPELAWAFENFDGLGFFGGVCVAPPSVAGGAPRVYAASYAFTGRIDSANLVRLDGRTGEPHWSVPSNRTITTPVALPGGRVLLSGGIQGFGSVPSLRLYQDFEDHATEVWDSARDTWVDADGDGSMDPGEYTRLGGWTHQPGVCAFAGRVHAVCGVISAGQFSNPSERLFVVDVDEHPASGSFIVGEHAGSGGSPAVLPGVAHSIGAAGLVAFGPTPAGLDVNADGVRTIDDLYAWEIGDGYRDIDADGVVGPLDRGLLHATMRTPWGLRDVGGRR